MSSIIATNFQLCFPLRAAVAVAEKKVFFYTSYQVIIFRYFHLVPLVTRQQFVINFECCNYFEIEKLDIESDLLWKARNLCLQSTYESLFREIILKLRLSGYRF